MRRRSVNRPFPFVAKRALSLATLELCAMVNRDKASRGKTKMSRPVLCLCAVLSLLVMTACTGDFDIPPQKSIDRDVSAARNGGGSTLGHDGPHPVPIPHD